MINFKVMKCMNLVFSIKDIKTNIGFYSFFPTIIAYVISLFLYSLLEFKIISFKINEIISSKKIMKLIINKKKLSKKIRKRKNLLEKNFFRKSYFEENELEFKGKDKKFWNKNKNFVNYFAIIDKEKKLTTIKEEIYSQRKDFENNNIYNMNNIDNINIKKNRNKK